MGQPLAWRTLRVKSSPNAAEWPNSSQIFVDNFDQDPDEEVIVFMGLGNEVFELSKPSAAATSLALPKLKCFECWDFDGDGTAEFLEMVKTESAKPPTKVVDVMLVYSTAGKTLGYVRGNPMGPRIARGDFNGDGTIDLYMAAESAYSADPTIKAQAFTTDGEVLFTAPADWNSPYVAIGDVDKDGCDDVVTPINGMATAYGIERKQMPFTVWNHRVPEADPAWFADLTGDGIDEALSSAGAVLDYTTDTLWQLARPSGWTQLHIDGLFGPKIVAGSFPGFSGTCIAALPTERAIDAEALVVWQADGTLVYMEYFDEIVDAIGLATSATGDQLVLLTESKLLVWP